MQHAAVIQVVGYFETFQKLYRKRCELIVDYVVKGAILNTVRETNEPHNNMNNIDRAALVSENLNEYVTTNEGLRRLSNILDESQSAKCPHTTEQDRSFTLADDTLTVGELMDCRSDLFTVEEE